MLGPFVLTGLLMPRILEAPAPRVVTVASYAHTQVGPMPILGPPVEQETAPFAHNAAAGRRLWALERISEVHYPLA